MAVIAHLMTRGTRRDYRFLTAGPPPWWEPVSRWVNEEKPAVVAHGGPGTARLLVTGIPSGRRDLRNTPIRFTLALESTEPELLVRFATIGLDAALRAELGRTLDAELPAARVDALLAGEPAAGDDLGGVGGDDLGDLGDLDRRLGRALAAAVGPTPGPDRPDDRSSWAASSWAAGQQHAGATLAFLSRVRALTAGGVAGWAFTATLVSGVEGARRVAAELGDPLAILLADDSEVVDLGKGSAGRTPGRPGGDPRTTRPPVGTSGRPGRRRAVVITVLVIVLLAVLGALELARPPGPATPGSAGHPTTPSSSTPAAPAGPG